MSTDPPSSGESPRRATGRLPYTCLAWIENAESHQVSGIARIQDISPRGIGLVLAAPIPAGSRVVVDILIPGPLRLRAQGEVVHATALGNGQTRVGVRLDSAPALTEIQNSGDDAWRT